MIRSYVRLVAIALLVAAPVAFLHTGQDDVACALAGGAQTDGATVKNTTAANGAEHCLICHWTRSFRSPFASTAHLESVLVITARVDVSPDAEQCAPPLDQLPARAPPAIA